MTLPQGNFYFVYYLNSNDIDFFNLDVSIQTNSADKSKIFLKAGQKVIVLKSPKGICLQLESGKVIAIRASMKSGNSAPGSEHKLGGLNIADKLPNTSSVSVPKLPFRNVIDNDVIDISNDDDDDGSVKKMPEVDSLEPFSSNSSTVTKPAESTDLICKEKVIYRPNLIQRRPKMPSSSVPMPREFKNLHPISEKLDSQKTPSTAPNNLFDRNVNGANVYPTTSKISKLRIKHFKKSLNIYSIFHSTR